MKKIFWFMMGFILMFSFGICHGATLVWDAPITGGAPDGYIMYYTDGVNNHNYNVGNQTTCGTDVLNLAFGVEYTFHVTAYNAAGESGPSNTALWTDETYVPPANNLPPIVIEISGPVTITIGN